MPRLDPHRPAPGLDRTATSRSAGPESTTPGGSPALSITEKARRARALALDSGGHMPDACWALIYDFETAPWTTDAERLAHEGHELVPSGQVDDGELPEAVDALGRALAALRVHVRGHERFSDRALYRVLVEALLHEPRKDVREFPAGGGWVIALDDFVHGPPAVDPGPPASREVRTRRRRAFPEIELPDDRPVSVSGPRGVGYHHCLRGLPD